MKTVLHWSLIVAQAALLVLSVIALFKPEARGLPMRLAIVFLYLVCSVPVLRDLRAVMHKSPGEAAPMLRGKVTVLESLALLVGAAGLTVALVL